jgi:hypothetical protein
MNKEFTPKTITTKQSHHCAFCSKKHKTGSAVLMSFDRGALGTVTTVVCDGECEMKLNQRSRAVKSMTLDGFLGRRSVQFN